MFQRCYSPKNKEYKSVTSFGNTTVTQTAHEIDLKVGPDIKIPPEVTFKDVKNETVLGDPNNIYRRI